MYIDFISSIRKSDGNTYSVSAYRGFVSALNDLNIIHEHTPKSNSTARLKSNMQEFLRVQVTKLAMNSNKSVKEEKKIDIHTFSMVVRRNA